MSKIKILAIPSDNHGVGKYRILDPYKYIGENHGDEFHVDISFDVPNDDKFFEDYDVVVFHSFIHKTSHEDNVKRIEWLKSKGIKTVVDIDDLWSVDPKHPMYQQIKQNNVPQKKVEFLRLSDYISTTTPIFADTIKQRLNLRNTFVFPNAVDENEPQFQSKVEKSEKVRFGWLGGSSHLYDLQIIGSGISGTYSTFKDKVQFVLCGFDTRGNVTEFDKTTGQQRRRPILPHETVWFQYENISSPIYATGIGLVLKGFEQEERGDSTDVASSASEIRTHADPRKKGAFFAKVLSKENLKKLENYFMKDED